MLLLSTLVVLTFLDYGLPWDEPVQATYGRLVLWYYKSGFKFLDFEHYRDLRLYGALFESLAALVKYLSPIGLYETRHFLNAFVGILGVVGCWKFANTLSGAKAAFLSALCLILIPT